MRNLIKPIEIVEHIASDLKANDCPALQMHLDDLQESLVERVMAGDLNHQHLALNRLKEIVALQSGLGSDALRGLLNRLSITNETAQHLITKYDCPLLNNSVCDNLIHFRTERSPESRVSSFGLALYWLNSGDHDIFNRFATYLINHRPNDTVLQYEIIEALALPMQKGNEDNSDTFYTWLARNQDKIIALSDGDPAHFGSRELDVAVVLAVNHIPRLGKLIAQNSRSSPRYNDLYLIRTMLDVRLSDERLLREWSGHNTGMGWAEVAVLQSLMSYHLAFEDSPAPVQIGGQDLNKANALIHALQFLDEQGISPLPSRISFLADRIVSDVEDEVYRKEIVELFEDSEFHRQLLSSTRYREETFGADLGL